MQEIQISEPILSLRIRKQHWWSVKYPFSHTRMLIWTEHFCICSFKSLLIKSWYLSSTTPWWSSETSTVVSLSHKIINTVFLKNYFCSSHPFIQNTENGESKLLGDLHTVTTNPHIKTRELGLGSSHMFLSFVKS